jgi:methylenetetrahydrofolate dehydrogenase (NADP+)/methenyltetrahydrofolate cyclohydrolase
MATLMDGRALAERVRARVAADTRELGHVGLTTVLVGDDAASELYIRLKHRAAEEAGIEAVDVRLPADIPEDDLLARVGDLNDSDGTDGLLVQLPLPPHLDEARVMRAVEPSKDVDGLHPFNAGQLLLGRPTFVGATPLGVMALLADYRIALDGARAVVVGRSDIVGKPVAQLLLAANATVTVCHSHTRDLARVTAEADVLVVAAGRAALVSPEMVKPGSAVVDVGINRVEDRTVGDVDPAAGDVAGYLTPVPGGVGPMTIAMLLWNTVQAARVRAGGLAFPGR